MITIAGIVPDCGIVVVYAGLLLGRYVVVVIVAAGSPIITSAGTVPDCGIVEVYAGLLLGR